MKRRRLILGMVVVSLVAVIILVRSRKQDDPPDVTFGPHKTKLRYIPFAEAHARPWFDLNLPLFGRVSFPKHTSLPGVNPKDDPRFIAGYIIGDEDVAWISSAAGQMPMRYAMPSATPTAIPVGYPADAFYTQATLTTLGPRSEQVKVTTDFQFYRLPARLAGQEYKVGELTLKPRVVLADGDKVSIRLQIDAPLKEGQVVFDSDGMRQELSGTFPKVLSVLGSIQKDDAVLIEGKLGYKLTNGGQRALTPFQVMLKPKPQDLLR